MKTLSQLYSTQAKIFFRDWTTLIITLLLPVILATFFALIFRSTDSTLRMTVVDDDHTTLTQQVVQDIKTGSSGKIAVDITNEDDARSGLAEGGTDVVLVFPEGMTDAVQSGRATSVVVLYDPARAQSAGVGVQVARSMLAEFNLAASGATPLLRPQAETIQSEQHSLAEFYLPNFLALSVLWMGLFATALPIVRDREAGVLLRVGATPLSPTVLIAGLTLWRLTLGVIQTVIFLVVGIGILGLPLPSNLALLAAAVVLGNLVFVTMGFMISSLASSIEGANTLAQLVNFPMMFLSGIFFTADMLPGILTKISLLIPLTYLADVYRQILVGYPGVVPLWVGFMVLGLFGVLCAGVSVRTWRWQ